MRTYLGQYDGYYYHNALALPKLPAESRQLVNASVASWYTLTIQICLYQNGSLVELYILTESNRFHISRKSPFSILL